MFYNQIISSFQGGEPNSNHCLEIIQMSGRQTLRVDLTHMLFTRSISQRSVHQTVSSSLPAAYRTGFPENMQGKNGDKMKLPVSYANRLSKKIKRPHPEGPPVTGQEHR